MRSYQNNYSTTITTTTLGTVDTSVAVTTAPAALSAGQYYVATLTDSLTAPTKTEIVRITAISANTLTIERAQEGTTAQTFASGDFIEIRATRDSFLILDGPTLVGYTETVATGTTTLDNADGTIKNYTMTANTTFTDGLSSGQSLTLHLSGGTTYTATWPIITWVGGTPTLAANTVLEFWKIGSTLYGATVGDY